MMMAPNFMLFPFYFCATAQQVQNKLQSAQRRAA
jgi:hypothetical protein